MRASCVRRSRGDVPCKFNLIPFNPFPASGFKRSPPERIRRFAEVLQDAGIVTTVRKTRGDDIDAACGQLAGEVAGPHARRPERRRLEGDARMRAILIATRACCCSPRRCAGRARRRRPRTEHRAPIIAEDGAIRATARALHTELAGGYSSAATWASALEELRARRRRPELRARATACSAWCTWSCRTTELAEAELRARAALAPHDADINHNYGWFLCQRKRERRVDQVLPAGDAQSAVSDPRRSYSMPGVCTRAGRRYHSEPSTISRALKVRARAAAGALQLADIAYKRRELSPRREAR